MSRRKRSPRRLDVERLESRSLLATLEQVYFENFENGDGGYVADNTGGSVLGLWHYSIGRRADGLPNHSPDHNWYYGAFETSSGGGRYDVFPFDHQGTLESPAIQLPDCGTSSLSFSYVLNTRPELDRDFVDVFVIDDSGQTLLLSRQDGLLPQSGYDQWLTATGDLSAFRGEEIRLLFSFRTGTPPQVDPEGWYVDDILITSLCEPVTDSVDLSVLKTASDLTPDELQSITYTITAANSAASNAAATSVVVTDNLPAGVTFVSANASEGTYNSATDLWTGLDLSPGETRTLSITVTVNAGTAGQTLINTAAISGAETDPNSANNQSTVQVVVNPNPNPTSVDLSVLKSVDDPSPSEGQTITYTITAQSAITSSDPAAGVTVTDNLPTGVTFISATASEGTYNPANDTWSGLNLSPGESQTLSIVVTVNAGTAGQSLSNTVVIDGPDEDPQPGNDDSTVTLAVNSVVQFIAPLSLYRTAGPFAPPAPTVVAPPPAGLATVKGFKWHDLDQDGVWDAGEAGRPGWEIFLDANGDNVFDPQTEQFAITATDGSYVFANLAPGIYTIREDRAGLSDGIFQVQRFPAADPSGQRDPDEHRVTVVAGQILEGHFGVTEVPNFGSFDYSPFIRPADNFPGRFAALPGERQALLSATLPWQSFLVGNSTGRPLRITALNKVIDTSVIAVAAQFVTLFQRTGSVLTTPTFPLDVPAGTSVEFFAFYDPAIRSGDTVTAQYPDWFDDPSTTGAGQNESRNRPPHTFGPSDHLEAVTTFTDVAESGPTFATQLVGGSTYDSDISYDGRVENEDVARLADLLADAAYEPTSDMNARFPNGAGGTVNSGTWPIAGTPAREIANGDFAPLNIEFGRSRAPFLDLDTDDSTAQGVDFATEFVNGSARVIDADGRFANRSALRLSSVELTIANPLDGALEDFDFANLPVGITGQSQFTSGVRKLMLTGNSSVESYAQALQSIAYKNADPTPTAGTRTIRIQATGGNDFLFAWEGAANAAFDSRVGNVAFARILVKPTSANSLVAEAEAATPEGEPDSLVLAAPAHVATDCSAGIAFSAAADGMLATARVAGPLQPEVWALLKLGAVDLFWLSAEPRDHRRTSVPAALAAPTLAPACSDEQEARELLFAQMDEDDLDPLAAPE